MHSINIMLNFECDANSKAVMKTKKYEKFNNKSIFINKKFKEYIYIYIYIYINSESNNYSSISKIRRIKEV